VRQKQCQAYFTCTTKKSHDRELNVSLNRQRLTHDPHPVYLDVTLDRTLSYKHHLTKTAAKLRSRNISSSPKIDRFFIGCKRCHSPFFCVSPLLFSQ